MNIISFTIGKRIVLGFSIIIAILLVLGSTAYNRMQRVRDIAFTIASENVPAVEVANNVERTSLETMYEMRGYAFTEETKYFDAAKRHLEQVRQALNNAKELGESTTALAALKSAAMNAEKAALNYEQLAQETVNVTADLEKERQSAEAAALNYMNACNLWDKLEDAKLEKDVQRNAKLEEILAIQAKSNIAADIKELGNAIIIGTWKSQFRRSPEIFNEAQAKFAQVEAKLDELRKMNPDVEESRLIEACATAGAIYKGNMERFLASWKKREELGKQRQAAADKVLEEAKSTASNQLIVTQRATKAAALSLQESALVLLGGLIAAFVLGAAVAIWIVRSIVVPLKDIVAFIEPLAKGDFSQNLPERLSGRGDEIGLLSRSFAGMIRSLTDLVVQVQRSGLQVNSSAVEIAATTKEQQATASEVATTSAEISATAKEMSATSSELLKTADNVSSVAEQASELASGGKEGLVRMEKIMRGILDAAAGITAKLGVMNEKAGNINAVVSTIGKVADQTNLLSLNAAIEAEKAGEYGRGFSVVATEIRRLADQTAASTGDIEQMVKEMVSAVSAGVMGMDKFAEELRRGAMEISGVSAQLDRVISEVQSVAPSVESVNEGMRSQTQGAQQISDALSQLGDAARLTADSIRESSRSIDQLNEATRGLQTGVARFKLPD